MRISTLRRTALAALVLVWVAACTSDRIPAGQCEFDSECASGQVCAGRTCRAQCATDADCARGQRCVAADRPGAMACVSPPADTPACVRDSDCADGQACLDGLCRPQCQTNYDCQVVNPLAVCTSGRCVPQCTVGRADCDGVMPNGCEVDTRTDVRNCSACGRACPAGEVCSAGACRSICAADETNCSGSCLHVATDLSNCGRCGNVCPMPANATATCAAGACGYTCSAGFGDCDGVSSNGCETALDTAAHCGACDTRCSEATPLCTPGEGGRRSCTATPCSGAVCSGACVDTQTDVMNCGACGTACPAGSHSAARCEAGRCALRCDDVTRYRDCDGMASNGCEAELPVDPMNCGACGTRCEGGANATGQCASMACRLVCNAGFGDCDGVASNGCEASTASDATNCGMCGRACSAPSNARATCAAGACGFVCATGFADCDMSATTGCEVNTQSDRANCGACGRACAAGEVCSAGACASSCPTGITNCSGSCADLNTSVSHCGMCGRACPSPANAAASCAAARCGFACNTGFGDCDGNPANGCETSLSSSPASCGRCGNACSLANATAGCSGGACAIASCNAGFANCDAATSNGCEVNTGTDASHCGACGRACSLANATSTCAAGVCAIARCNAGFADCNRDPSDGCEVNTTTSTAHCGGCGMACSAAGGAPMCAAGVCAITCATGRGNCNMNATDGCEVDTTSAVSNCGACGRACTVPNASPACVASACAVASCNAGFGDCDGNPANGCEVNLTSSASSCGACGRACSLANATASCAAGACAIASCNAGYANCDGNPANGCEVNLNADPTRCGSCSTACNATGGSPTCASGVCGISCSAGRGNCNMSAADGCEVDTNTAVSHCGACGRACSLANATASCAGGACAISACATGYADCDGNPANGCEVNLNTDTTHCGRCATACAAGQLCSSGACTLVCGAGLTNCGGRCVSLASDTSNCGTCGVVCPARASASTTCASGACGFACATGFADCNGVASDGCEVNTQTSATSCGRCGAACNATGGTAMCAAGACAITCAIGRGDCNASAADGCEVDTNTAVSHCGACGRACSLANATASCAGGACAISACATGYADCDHNPANGCEVNVTNNASNCGACGSACSFANASAACAAGACVIASCNAGYGNCDAVASNGCETDTNNTVAHCGGCGMACSANHGLASCSGGACGIICQRTGSIDGFFYYTSLWGNCDGDARSNGCESDLLTVSNCQACGNACSFPNAAPACGQNSGTQCYLGTCNTGFADCNGAPSDGCEVNTTSDSLNCGICGRSCARETAASGVTHACRTSTCRPANDVCSGATPINLTAGRQIWLNGLTGSALHDIDPSCRATTSPDVFFSFTLTQRELVYADTFGDGSTAHPTPTWDTVLFFASSCTTSMPASGGPAGSVYCNDDASSLGCSSDGNRSQVSAVLDPGTYYLVLSGYGGASGQAPINFQHLPVGNGTAVNIATMGIGSSVNLPGTTSGAGTLAPSATCSANGPEITYWWRVCTGGSRFNLSATTCNTTTAYDTVIYYRTPYNTADICNDDDTACTARGTASTFYTTVFGDTGVRTVTVDGYSSTSMGAYLLTLNGYAIIATMDPARGVCRDPRRPAPPSRTHASATHRRPRA